MASGVPLPHDKKRVKVYELRNNDWFDRGTGFCTGRIINVSIEQICRQSRPSCSVASSDPFIGTGEMLISIHRRTRRSLSSRKMNRSESSWKRRYRRMTVIRSNKVISHI